MAGISRDTFIKDPMSSNTLKNYVCSPENHNTEQFGKESGFSGTVRLFFLERQEVHVKQTLMQFQHCF